MMETHVLGFFVADFGDRNLRGARERWGWDGVQMEM